jgi:hypothetical protein
LGGLLLERLLLAIPLSRYLLPLLLLLLLLLLLGWLGLWLRLRLGLSPLRLSSLLSATWGNIKSSINSLRDGLDLRSKLLFNLIQIETILIGNKIDSQTQMPKSARTTNTMKVSFAVLGEIKVDDNVYCLNIDTTCKEVGADEVTAHAVTEVVENAITVRLQHFCMGVETRVAQLCHFLSEELDTVGRITENDRLINLQLRSIRLSELV